MQPAVESPGNGAVRGLGRRNVCILTICFLQKICFSVFFGERSSHLTPPRPVRIAKVGRKGGKSCPFSRQISRHHKILKETRCCGPNSGGYSSPKKTFLQKVGERVMSANRQRNAFHVISQTFRAHNLTTLDPLDSDAKKRPAPSNKLVRQPRKSFISKEVSSPLCTCSRTPRIW